MDKVTQTIDSCIGVIKRIKPFVPPASLRYICNALVQPHFNYCVAVWEKCGETLYQITYQNFKSVMLALLHSPSMMLMPSAYWND